MHCSGSGKVFSHLPGGMHIGISGLLEARSPWEPEGVAHWHLHLRGPSAEGISPDR